MLRVVLGTMHTRKKRREQPVSMNVAGRWIQIPPAHVGEGELRSRESCQGTGNLRVRAAIVLELCHDNVNQKVFQQAQPLWLGNGNSRNTARAGGPHQGLGFADRAVVCNLSVKCKRQGGCSLCSGAAVAKMAE